MTWYYYSWTSDLLPSKLKDKSIKRHIWKYKHFIQYETNYPYLKADSQRENYECNAVLQCPCIWENSSVGSQGRIDLCSKGVFGVVLFYLCVCVYVFFNEELKPLHLVIYFPPLESTCPGHAASLLCSPHLSWLARGYGCMTTMKGCHCWCHSAVTRACASPSS